MDGSIESFAKDKDISELLELLGQMKNRDGYEKMMDTISYVDSLENTLSAMMKQIVDMREEIKTVHEQNDYLMSRAERGVKDILLVQVNKAEEKVQEFHNKLMEAKENLKSFASGTYKGKKYSCKIKVVGNDDSSEEKAEEEDQSQSGNAKLNASEIDLYYLDDEDR